MCVYSPFVFLLICFFSSSRSFLSAPCKQTADRIKRQLNILAPSPVYLLAADRASGLPHLIAEDLDLSEGPVDGPAAAAAVAVGVNLDNQRHPLHAFLRGEVRAQTVHGDKDLGDKEAG